LKPKHRGKGKKDYRSETDPKPWVDAEELISQVWGIIGPLCEYEGIELVHVEYQRESRGKVLRLYIDRPRGVTLDDCTAISRQAGDLLDVELGNIGPYALEVSSPGADRPISREEDFSRFRGEWVKIKTVRSIDGRKNFKGVLKGISSGQVALMVDDSMMAIPYDDIVNARLVSQVNPFDSNQLGRT